MNPAQAERIAQEKAAKERLTNREKEVVIELLGEEYQRVHQEIMERYSNKESLKNDLKALLSLHKIIQKLNHHG